MKYGSAVNWCWITFRLHLDCLQAPLQFAVFGQREADQSRDPQLHRAHLQTLTLREGSGWLIDWLWAVTAGWVVSSTIWPSSSSSLPSSAPPTSLPPPSPGASQSTPTLRRLWQAAAGQLEILQRAASSTVGRRSWAKLRSREEKKPKVGSITIPLISTSLRGLTPIPSICDPNIFQK